VQPEIPIIPITPISDESFSPEVTRAKEIMGENFIGPETVMKHFNIPLDKNGVEAFKKIPFSEETLITHKDDCILVADFGISLANLEKLTIKEVFLGFHDDCWYNPDKFKDYNLTRKPQWQLIHKNYLPNPLYKNYYEQLNSLSEKLYVPSACTIAYSVLLYYLQTKNLLFYGEYVSSSDIGSDQDGSLSHVKIGCLVLSFLYQNNKPDIDITTGYNDYNDYNKPRDYDPNYDPNFITDASKMHTIHLITALKPEK
jgi:hypothetical protein